MKIPKSFDDITIEEYQFAFSALKYIDKLSPLDEKLAWISILSYFAGKDEEYFEKMPFKELNPLIEQVMFIVKPYGKFPVNESIIVNNQIYKGLTDISNGSFAQYTSIKTLLTKYPDKVSALHMLAGCIYAPKEYFGKDYDMMEVSEKLKKAKVSQVLGLVFFYSRILNALTPIITNYLKHLKGEFLNQEKNSQTFTAGMQHLNHYVKTST